MIYTFGDDMRLTAMIYQACGLDKKTTGRNLSFFGAGDGISARGGHCRQIVRRTIWSSRLLRSDKSLCDFLPFQIPSLN